MFRFKSSPRRVRAVRLSALLALALALASVFGAPAAAAASPTKVSLSCIPATVKAGETTHCLALVASVGNTPTGNVWFEATGFGEFGTAECTLIKASAGQSFCYLAIRTTVPGKQTLLANYSDPTHEFAFASTTLTAAPSGSMTVDCSPELGFVGDLTTCEAFVPDTPGVAAHPNGVVNFLVEGPGTVKFFPGAIDPECVLEAIPSGSRCSVEFEPETEGTFAMVAGYPGDGAHPANRGSQIYRVREQHETSTSVSCDNTGPVIRNAITCTATVVNEEATGGAPTGEVEFENELEGIFPGTTGPFCFLAPVAPKSQKSSCQAQFSPEEVGPQLLEAVFKGSPRFEFGSGAILLEPVAGHKTATKVTCTQSHGTSPGTCTATVTDTETNPVAPEGKVAWRSSGEVKFSGEHCQLSPTSTVGASQCSVSYTMTVVGNRLIFVDYLGNVALHQPSNAQGVAEGR